MPSFSWADFHRLTLGIWATGFRKNFESQSTSYGFSHLFYDAVLHFGFYNSIKQPYSADGGSAFSILLSLLGQICLNPWILSVFLLSIFASAVQSANIPNWLALITDVNLPSTGLQVSVYPIL